LQRLLSKQDGIRNREKVYNQSYQSQTFIRQLANKTICGTTEGQCKKNVDRLPNYWYANSHQGCDQISHLSDINFLTLVGPIVTFEFQHSACTVGPRLRVTLTKQFGVLCDFTERFSF